MQKKTTLGYFFQFAKKYKKAYLLMVFSTIITTVAGFILIPLFFKELLDNLVSFQGSDKSLLENELLRIWLIIALLDFTAFVVFKRITDFSIAYFQANLMRDLENFCFERLQNHSYDFFANNFVGSLVSKVHRFYRSAERIDDLFQYKIYPGIIKFSISITIIFLFAPAIALIVVFWMILFLTGVFVLIKKYQIPLDQKSAAVSSETTGALADPITNTTAIKMFARKKYESNRFLKAVTRLFKSRKKAWDTHNYINAFQSAMITIVQTVVLYIIIKMWLNEAITVGTIVLINGYLSHLYVNLFDFGHTLKDWNQAMADAKEMTDILNSPPEINDVKNPEKCNIIRGLIEFKKINFSYESVPIFKNFNLKIKPGEKVGLVGESGAGKTTITKLLLRFTDIQKGTITIDNQDISKIKQEDLRSRISFVPQESVLFHRSLFENIHYGDLGTDKKAVFAAAKKANAHDFINNTPQKYNTLVGERGIKLSGGERQRISIARAMLKNAPILILDEATASLDSKSEKLIQGALSKLIKNKTTIIIAHRLSTLRKMDRIIVLDKGKIVEKGSHKALLRKNGKYAELWKHQTGYLD